MIPDNYFRLRTEPIGMVRDAIRYASYQGYTDGLIAGHLKAKIIILPAVHALNFMRFCQRNPKPCPLVGVSESGDRIMHTLGADIDIRTDIPAHNITRSCDEKVAATPKVR
jgi:uncharacterized protein YcsI (UPF0317 family)